MAITFLKKGKAAQAALQKADAEAEIRKQNRETPFRFWLEQNQEKQITFLDGVLQEDGTLAAPMYNEHNIKLNGKFGNTFVCIQETESCPLCASGDFPSLVAVFTVIDHSEWKGENGKVYKNERKLFVCKANSYKRLQHKAAKHGGLVGVTFDVTRIGDKSERVGSDFEFVTKRTLAEIETVYNLTPENAKPYDYEDGKTIVLHDAATMMKLGVGVASAPVGAGDSPFKHESKTVENPDYTKVM